MIRGDLNGVDVQTAYGLAARVTAPRWLDSLNPTCFLHQVEVTPACVKPLADTSGEKQFNIVMGAYSPWYFFGMGVPTLGLSGRGTLYLMRALTALVCAALLASAFASAQRLGRWAVIGVFAALTPMVLYLGGVINPNGIEIASAIVVWISAAALARANAIDERLLARTAIAYAICVNTRALSLPLASIAVVVPILFLAGRERWRAIAALRRFRLWVGVAAVGIVFELGWSLYEGVKDDLLPKVSFTFFDGLRLTWTVFVEAIATFGWTDVRIPGLAVLWLVVFVVLVALALSYATLREGTVLVGLIVAAVVLPIFVRMLQLPRLHAVWLGRYGLPLSSGVPILAGVLIATRLTRPTRVTQIGSVVLPAGLAVGQVVAFWVTARRYGVGASGRVLYFVDPIWSPPLSSVLPVVAFAIAVGALAYRSSTAGPPRPPPAEHPAAEAELVHADGR